MLDGSLTIRFQGEDEQLQAGDSVLLDSSEPHSYRGNAPEGATAIVVTVAPRL